MPKLQYCVLPAKHDGGDLAGQAGASRGMLGEKVPDGYIGGRLDAHCELGCSRYGAQTLVKNLRLIS